MARDESALMPNIAASAANPATKNNFRSTACSGALAASTFCRLRKT